MRRRRLAVLGSLLALALTLPGCAFGSTPAPIPGVKRARAPDRQAATLVVFLPGFGDRPERYLEHRVIDRLQATGVDVDAIALDGHFGYYASGELWLRVHDDVVAPARARGQRVWIFGLSMGGLGALMTASQRRGTVDGIVLMSPYTGRRRTTRAIARAGGPRAWRPPQGPGRWDVELWRWLRDYDASAPEYPEIFLGYGLDESGADGNFPLIASLLPADRVYTRAGPHDWSTWNQLWDDMLSEVVRAIERDASSASAATAATRAG